MTQIQVIKIIEYSESESTYTIQEISIYSKWQI